jgi:hypothetical protein
VGVTASKIVASDALGVIDLTLSRSFEQVSRLRMLVELSD